MFTTMKKIKCAKATICFFLLQQHTVTYTYKYIKYSNYIIIYVWRFQEIKSQIILYFEYVVLCTKFVIYYAKYFSLTDLVCA